MSHPLDIYRQEIIEAEKIRATFMQWKLLVVGAIAGFGLSATHVLDVQMRTIILMIIPLVCLYVDICCYQTTLRILVIADFIAMVVTTKDYFKESVADTSVYVAYERHCKEKWNKGFFSLEDWALVWSSVGANALLIVYYVIVYLPLLIKNFECSLLITFIVSVFISFFGGAGSLIAHRVFLNKARELHWIGNSA